MHVMRRPPIRVLDVAGTPEEMGRSHGLAYAAEIRRYALEGAGAVEHAGSQPDGMGHRPEDAGIAVQPLTIEERLRRHALLLGAFCAGTIARCATTANRRWQPADTPPRLPIGWPR